MLFGHYRISRLRLGTVHFLFILRCISNQIKILRGIKTLCRIKVLGNLALNNCEAYFSTFEIAWKSECRGAKIISLFLSGGRFGDFNRRRFSLRELMRRGAVGIFKIEPGEFREKSRRRQYFPQCNCQILSVLGCVWVIDVHHGSFLLMWVYSAAHSSFSDRYGSRISV